MERDGRTDALGGLILALLLAGGLCAKPAPAPFLPLLRAIPDQPALQVALGAPISPRCADVRAWETLPGIGPKRAQDLAAAAAAGLLISADDLLQVPGIGIKMAALLAPRVQWDLPAPRPREDPPP